MKCIVSGCELAARGPIRSAYLTEPWMSCGVHRAALATLLNKTASRYETRRKRALDKLVAELVEGLDALGDHEAEGIFLAT